MPFSRERALSDLGSQTLTKSGKKSTAEALGKATLIGIYFSAHWVSPLNSFMFAVNMQKFFNVGITYI